MARLIPDKPEMERRVKPENGKTFTLTELYRLLECSTIEILQLRGLGTNMVMVIDEEGKLKSRTFNVRATRLAHRHTFIARTDYIVGPALVADLAELNEEET